MSKAVSLPDRAALRFAVTIAIGVGILWALANLFFETILLVQYFHKLPDNTLIAKIMGQALHLFPMGHIWLGLRIIAFYLVLGILVGILAGACAVGSGGWPTTRRRKIIFVFLTCLYLGLVMLFAFWKFYFYFPAAAPLSKSHALMSALAKRTEPVHFQIVASLFLLVQSLLFLQKIGVRPMILMRQVKRRWKPIAAAFAAAVLILVIQELPASPQNRGPNIILLCFDSLLPDHLHSESYVRNTSPHIDRFRSESVFFRDAFTPIARTMSSWAGMITGTYPHRHGIRWDLPSTRRRKFISPNLLTELKKGGYHLTFMTDDSTFSYMDREMGWDTIVQPDPGYFNFLTGYAMKLNLIELFGNNRFGEFFFPLKKCNRAVADTYQPEDMTGKIVQMLHTLKGEKKFMLAVHFDILHAPGTVPYPHYRYFENGQFEVPYRFLFGDTDLSFLKSDFSGSLDQRQEVIGHQTLIYDKLFRASDEQFGRIWQAIKELNFERNSLIILCSDHGEKLEVVPNHGNTLHRGDDANSILLMIRFPEGGPKGIAVDELVSNIDIFPTVLDYLDRQIPATVEGISLLNLLKGRVDSNRIIFGETALNYLTGKACDYAADHPMLGNPVRLYALEPDGKIAVDEQFCREIMHTKDFMARSCDYKLVALPRLEGSFRYQMYDVRENRQNMVPVKGSNPDIYSSLVSALNDYIREQPASSCP